MHTGSFESFCICVMICYDGPLKLLWKFIRNYSQLKQSKEFEKSTEYVPLTKYTSGQISLQEFEVCTKQATQVEDLKSSGLTDEEVELILDHGKGTAFFSEKYKKLESSVLNSRLQRIFSKLTSNKEEQKWDNSKQRSVRNGILFRKIIHYCIHFVQSVSYASFFASLNTFTLEVAYFHF